MKIVYNRLIPFKGFLAINLFSVLFVRGSRQELDERIINHEKIHTAQMKELGFLLFYVLYVLEWMIRLFMKGNSYRSISFEREAYRHETDQDYLRRRVKYAMWRKR